MGVGVEKVVEPKSESRALKIVINKDCATVMESATVTRAWVVETVLLQCLAPVGVPNTVFASTGNASANLGTWAPIARLPSMQKVAQHLLLRKRSSSHQKFALISVRTTGSA